MKYGEICKEKSTWFYYNDWWYGFVKPRWTYYVLLPLWLPFRKKQWKQNLWPFGWDSQMFHAYTSMKYKNN